MEGCLSSLESRLIEKVMTTSSFYDIIVFLIMTGLETNFFSLVAQWLVRGLISLAKINFISEPFFFCIISHYVQNV